LVEVKSKLEITSHCFYNNQNYCRHFCFI